jgi:tetratricopeptide (TPR) repeat protein
MKRYCCSLLTALFLLSAALLAHAQSGETATLRGNITDLQGQPVPGVTIQLVGKSMGQRYSTKSDKKGDYQIVGIAGDTYAFTALKDGRKVYEEDPLPISLGATTLGRNVQGEHILNVVLGKSAMAATVPLTAPQKQALEELQGLAASAPKKDSKLTKKITEQLQAAQAADRTGDWDKVIATLTEVTKLDPISDLAWQGIGLGYIKTGKFDLAVPAYEKAVALKPGFAGYHANLALCYVQTKHPDEAIAELHSAAQLDPSKAARFYYSIGALESDRNHPKLAVEAFDKAIAADPSMADAYYFKGVNLIAQAKTEGGKLVAPAGTAEALKKYLELDPNGKHAASAKAQLGRVGG